MEATSYGASQRRKIILGRKDKNKEGKPVLKIRVPEIPPEKGQRSFEAYTTEKGTYYYECFSGFTGIIVDIYQANKEIDKQNIPFLFCEVLSGGEHLTFEVARLDHKFSINLLSRLFNPAYQQGTPAEFSPYDYEKNGTRYVGIAVRQNGNVVPSVARDQFDLLNRPQPDTWQARGGKTEYDFTPVAKWMLERVAAKISGFIDPAAMQVKPDNITVPAAPTVTTTPAIADEFAGLVEPDADGLPF